jgi:hypothetical protein
MKAFILMMTLFASLSVFAEEVESNCAQIIDSADRSAEEISVKPSHPEATKPGSSKL